MKIKLDNKTITLEQVQAAKEFAKEYGWLTMDEVKSVVRGNVGGSAVTDLEIIGNPVLNVAMNDYRMTIWLECWATFWRHGDRAGAYTAKVSADMLKWLNGAEKAAFVVEYQESGSYVTSGTEE